MRVALSRLIISRFFKVYQAIRSIEQKRKLNEYKNNGDEDHLINRLCLEGRLQTPEYIRRLFVEENCDLNTRTIRPQEDGFCAQRPAKPNLIGCT